jgi:uroporphyrinogen decarboxylase
MTGKERIIAALQHKEADRIPTGENQFYGALASEIVGYHTFYATGWEEMKALWEGKRDEIAWDYSRTIVDLAKILNLDYVRVPLVPAKKEKYEHPKMTGPYSWLDDKGNEYSFNPEAGDVVSPKFNADINIDDILDPAQDTFKVDESELEALRYIVKELKGKCFIIGRTPVDGTFPWQQTVGMEEFLMRMLMDEDFCTKAIDLYVSRSVKTIEAMLDAGADAVMTTDDYSDNRGPIMGPVYFKKFILPGIKRQIEAAHKKGGYFIKHTDGNTWPILDDLIDAGIDGWHGIQINIGMDLKKLKEKYGDKICFFGGTNCDSLIKGKPEEIRQEVISAICNAGRGGGLVLTTSNVVPPGATYERYKIMRETLMKYGNYPISI